MSETELLHEGFNLMFLGMGFVFLFLVILVYAVKAMSFLVNRFAPEPVIAAKPAEAEPVTSDDSIPIQAILAAAIHHHRKIRSNQH